MWCALYLLILVLSGFAAVARLARRASRIETLALTLCMGPGIIGYLLIILSLLGFRPNRPEILLIGALLTAVGITVWKSPRPTPDPKIAGQPVPSWWIALCLLAIAYGFISATIDAFMYPVIEWDAFAIWQLKAKVLAIFRSE